MRGFEISAETNGVEVTVRCEGELDLVSAPLAEAELRRIESTNVERIVLDLRPVEFLDSTGLRVILSADSRARRQGRRLVIIAGPDAVHRVFRIALLDQRLEFMEPPDTGDEHA